MTVPGTKLSQIALAGSPPALSDTLVGVGGGTTDFRYTLGQIQISIGRILLTANPTYYVRTTGNDSNVGSLANPWLTLQHAMHVVATTLDICGFFVTIDIGAGTFVGVDVESCVGGGVVLFNGAGTASTTVTNSATGGAVNIGNDTNIRIAGASSNTALAIDNLTITGNDAPGNVAAINCISGALLYLGNPTSFTGSLKFDTITSQNIVLTWGASQVINVCTAVEIVNPAGPSAASFYVEASANSTYQEWATVNTLTGTPTFYSFYIGLDGGLIYLDANSFVGSIVGRPIWADANSVVDLALDSGVLPTGTLDSVLSGGSLLYTNFGPPPESTAYFDFMQLNGRTSGGVTVRAQAVAGSWTLQLPAIDGNNGDVLTTDGAGLTSWGSPAASLTVGASTITGGTNTHVPYNNAGVYDEAANFTISSGNPNVTAGNAYLYDGITFLQALPLLGNWFSGNSGNLTVTGITNLADGNAAMQSVTTGSNNVAIGASALQNLLSGASNFALGTSSLAALTTANSSVAIGVGAGGTFNPGGGGSVVAIGANSLNANIDGGGCIGIGTNAIKTNAHGTGLIGIGIDALNTATGDHNIAIGYEGGIGITTGVKNTIIGGDDSFGGTDITTGSQNIQIGFRAYVPTATVNGQMSIANIIYGTGNTAVGTSISTGSIGIGIKAPAFKFDVAGSLGCSEATAILHNSTTVTGGATGNVPTLTAGPVTGNPTKWLPYDDNGTTRYIPSW